MKAWIECVNVPFEGRRLIVGEQRELPRCRKCGKAIYGNLTGPLRQMCLCRRPDPEPLAVISENGKAAT